jgi:hypothetical protein
MHRAKRQRRKENQGKTVHRAETQRRRDAEKIKTSISSRYRAKNRFKLNAAFALPPFAASCRAHNLVFAFTSFSVPAPPRDASPVVLAPGLPSFSAPASPAASVGATGQAKTLGTLDHFKLSGFGQAPFPVKSRDLRQGNPKHGPPGRDALPIAIINNGGACRQTGA